MASRKAWNTVPEGNLQARRLDQLMGRALSAPKQLLHMVIGTEVQDNSQQRALATTAAGTSSMWETGRLLG